jgi:hypothetical protein
MPKTPPPDQAPEATSELLEESFYEVPADLQDDTVRAEPSAPHPPPPDDEETDARPARRGGPALKIGIALGAVLLVLAVVLVYRSRERHRAVREGMAQAEKLMRADTADGYREAARFLEKLSDLDPVEVSSARAFALAMLAADYRDAKAAADANALLVVPGRAEAIPPRAALAFAALHLRTNSLGDATNQLGNAGDDPWARVLQARVALRAGTPDAAIEPATAAAAESGFAPGLAIHGDAIRRARRDGATARSAYEAALAVSPTEPRAVYGLAKLALAGQAPAIEATDALGRLASDPKTPAPERARAAMHLTALRLRAGEPSAEAPLDDPSLALDEPARSWARRAAAAEAGNRGAFRAVTGAPPALESASDDDPAELRPVAPPPPPPPPAATAAPEPKAVAKPATHAKPSKTGKAVKPGKTTKAGAKAKTTSKAKPKAAKKATTKKKSQ